MYIFERIQNLSFFLLSFISLVILFTNVTGTKRDISCSIYSDIENVLLNVIHIRADSSKDTIHYLWSSYDLPSVIVARTSTNTNVTLDVNKLRTFENGAITFSESPLALIGLTISEMWQLFYDTDSADINKASKIENLDLQNFHWDHVLNETLSCSNYSASINLHGFSDDQAFSQNGLFQLQFSVVGDEESAPDFPHLIYTGNSTQMKIELENLYSANSTRIRYGFEISMFSILKESCSDMHCKPVTTTLISDEFSPGIFSDVDILSPCSKDDNDKGSFLTWRPVAYTSDEPSVANSTEAKMTSNCAWTSISGVHSIAESYFNDQKNVSVNIFNVTFGAVGDGFYSKTKYAAWSLMLGTGVSVHNKLSTAAIVIMAVGVITLFVFGIAGLAYYVVRCCRKKDDDSLLGENSSN